MTRTSIALILAAVSLPAAAGQIFKCTDESGGTVITNAKTDKSCKPVSMTADSSFPAPAKAKTAAATPTPGSFPKVGEDTQKARDTDRRRILEQELSTEQRNLDQAKKELADQESAGGGSDPAKALDRLVPYKERVGQHERNIQAINKELANLK